MCRFGLNFFIFSCLAREGNFLPQEFKFWRPEKRLKQKTAAVGRGFSKILAALFVKDIDKKY